MLRSSFLVPLLLPCLLATASAQGVVNSSLLQPPAADPSGPRATGLVGAVSRSRAAVVYVCVEVDGPRGKFPIERASTGVIVDPSGLVLTWAHLIAEAAGAADKRLLVQLDDASHTQLPASVVSVDAATGLALLQVAPPAGGLTGVEFGVDMAAAGEPTVALCIPEGKELFAFAGVVSSAVAEVTLRGRSMAAREVLMTDGRADARCDGAAVLDAAGRLVGLYASEHVRRDVSEPKLEDLKQPSYGLVVPVGVVRRAFVAEFARPTVTNASLRKVPGPSPSANALAVARIAPAVVGVYGGQGSWPDLGKNDPGAAQRREGLGSGVVLAKKGLVVTNFHLCKTDTVSVRLLDGRTLPAKVLKKNFETNLAVLRVELPAGVELVAAACHADDDVVLGETVLAVGNPTGVLPVVTAGVLSALRGNGRLQADPNLGNPNGGGACIDACGRVLGIADAGMIDPLDLAFATRGDKVTTETNLSTFVGIRRVRMVFSKEIEDLAASDESIRTNAAATDERARRDSALTAMVAKTSKALLNVYVSYTTAKVDEDANPFAAAADAKQQLLGLGSGVIIDRSGLAISNWHVVDEATNPDGSMRKDHKVEVRVFGGKKYDVKVLSISREDDLSLLQLVLAPGEEVDAVELGSSEDLRIGECVAAIGNPHGAANTITFGVVSAKDQELRVRGRWAKLEHLIETDAAINGGNSGGALLDMNGRLVGINSAGGGTFTNRGYAIAVDHVRQRIVGLLMQSYKLRSPELGMRVLDDQGKVLVMDVDARGPAAKAGVMSGDCIQELGGTAITWSPGFARTLLQQTPGVATSLVVLRKGEKKAFPLVPVDPSIWAVIRQSGLGCREFGYAEDPELVRKSAVALHRRFTGDPTAEPLEIPNSVVRVEAVYPGTQPEGTDIAVGDLLLGAQFRSVDTNEPVLVPLADVTAIKDLFNDRQLGTYDGQEFLFWVARGGEIREVTITAKRLFW